MATTKNITMKQFNGTDYDTLYPKTIAAQIDDVYSKTETYPKSQLYTQSQLYTKAQTLTDTTKTLFGLTSAAVPNDALAYLGNYTQHWWRRRTKATQVCLGTLDKAWVSRWSNVDDFNTITYSSTVNIENRSVTLSSDKSTVKISYKNYTNANVLAGKYFQAPNNSDIIYYAPQNATVTQVKDNGAYYVYITCQLAYVWDVYGGYEYIQSTNRNAYPDSGISNGYEYFYLGRPLENLPICPRIQVGSYLGTGTYGSSNPCSLTFDFPPKIFMIVAQTYVTSVSCITYANTIYGTLFSDALITTFMPYFFKDNDSYSSSYTQAKKSEDGKTFYWYHDANAQYQFNELNRRFYWVAIG